MSGDADREARSAWMWAGIGASVAMLVALIWARGMASIERIHWRNEVMADVIGLLPAPEDQPRYLYCAGAMDERLCILDSRTGVMHVLDRERGVWGELIIGQQDTNRISSMYPWELDWKGRGINNGIPVAHDPFKTPDPGWTNRVRRRSLQ